jgi:dephospho-CoA kinase
MIIGLTGTLGSGKGTVVDYLKAKGYKHYSMSGFISEEIVRRGLPVNRDTMTSVGTDMRKMHGPDYLTQSLLERAQADTGNVVIESLRAPAEVEYLKSHGAVVWAVDADVAVRYERIMARKSEKDAVTFEKFKSDEERESVGTNPYEMNLPQCIQMADVTIMNNGTVADLDKEIEAALWN